MNAAPQLVRSCAPPPRRAPTAGTIVLLLLLVVLGGALTFLFLKQRSELRALAAAMAATQTAIAKSAEISADEIATLRSERAAQAAELADVKAKLDRVPATLLAEPRPLLEGERARINGRLVATHPELAAVRHRRDRRVIQRYFGDLIAEARLPAVETERLKELLVETRPYRTSDDPNKRAIELVEADIQALLNASSFQTYREITATLDEVHTAGLGKRILAQRLIHDGAAPLTPAQTRALVMIEKEVKRSRKYPAKHDETLYRQQVQQRAARVLTSDQLRSMQELDAEMIAELETARSKGTPQ